MAVNRKMYDTAEGNSKNISAGNETYLSYNDKNVPSNLYPNISGDLRSDIENNFVDINEYRQLTDNSLKPLGGYGIGDSRYDYGLTESEYPYLQNIRASRQGPIAQFGSFLNQAIVGELIGGTIEGIGYLGEINEFSDLMSGEDEEFGNALSRFGKSIREWAREATPVYEYDYREGDFRPWDWSWWMSNGPSIASSLSLMIPSGAVAAIPARLAKSLTFAGKYSAAIRAGRTAAEAAQIASKASTNISRTVAGLTQAVTSRKMEALMESNGTYDDAYQMAISSGKSEDEARQIAAKAAKNNYVANWAMLVQDVPQYLFLNKYIGKYLRGEADDTVKKMNVSAKNELGQKVSLRDYIPSLKSSYTLGKDMLGEAGEEAYQYLSNQYGLYSAERMINPDMDVSFIPWAKENIDIGEMATNAFFGAIGAGFMQGVGRPLMDKVRGVEDTQVLEIRSIAERYATIGKNILNAQKIGDDHKLAMELSKGGAELGIRAAMGNSKELLDSFINLVDSGDFSTASKDLQAFAETEEAKAIIAQDKKNASEIKKYAEEAYNLYNETLKNINQEGHTFNKGYKKALENLKKTGRSIDVEWYKKALASVMTSTSIGKSIIDNSIKNIEQELENSKDKYEKSANQAFKDLSLTGKGILFNELELEALQNIINKDNVIHNEDVMKQMPTKTKEDIDNWRKSIKKEIEKLEKTIQSLKDNYPDDDKTNDSSIKVNKADLLEYKELSNKLSLIKRDSYIFGQALKRYNNGELLSDSDIQKYAKEFEDRQEEEYKNGLQIGDTVTIGQDGPLAIIDNVKFTDNKRKYVVKQFAVNEDGSVDESNTLEEYDEDDIWLYDNSGKIDPSLVDTVSSTIEEKNNDPNAELRKSLHDKHLNDPLMTLGDMISMSHIEQSNPNEIIQRDPKLNSLLSTPLSAVDSIEQSLKDGRVEYSLDLSDKQKFWETHRELKKRILSIKGNKKLSDKVKTQRINKLISDLIDQVADNNFNHIIDTIPIKLTVVLKNKDSEQRFDGTDQFNLYVHNSDFWNLDAPASIYIEQGVEAAEEYILHQRQKTRAFRVTLLEKLLASDIAIGKGLKRYGGHLNRVATHGAIHERLGEELKDVDLWIGIQDSAGTTSPFMESGVAGMWHTQPGTVLFRTNKTLDGSDIFVHATVSNLSKEHAEILWDSYLIIAAGFGYSAKLNRDDVKNATVGEILDLLVAQGEKVSNNMKDKSQVLYLKGRKELHFGNQVIKDISKATASQRGKFIKWISENKKYRVPFEVAKLGFKLNSLYKNKSGIQIGSFEIKPGDTRTWAQMLMSTPISSGKGGARYAVSTNVERVLDEETGSFKETVIHSPALKVLDTDLDSFDKSNDQSESDTPVVSEKPTAEVKKTVKKSNSTIEEIEENRKKSLVVNIDSKFKPGIRRPGIGYENGQLVAKVLFKNHVGQTETRTFSSFEYGNINAPLFSERNLEEKQEYLKDAIEKLKIVINNFYDNEIKKITNKVEPQKISTKFIGLHGITESGTLIAEKLTDDGRGAFKFIEYDDNTGEIYFDPFTSSMERDALSNPDKYLKPYFKYPQYSQASKVGTPVPAKVEKINGEWRIVELGELMIDGILPKGSTYIVKTETKPVKQDINDILGSGIVIGEDDTVTGFYRSEQVDEETEKISETELTWLKDRLKSGSTTEMSDRFLEIIVDGESKQAYGVFKSSAIYLYSNAPKGTVYHEAFHRVSLGYLSDIERKQFYDAARKKYNILDASDSQVEERLAEEFRAWRNYMEVKDGEEPTSIFDWIKNLFNFIKHYFTGKNAIANYELDTLFKLIDRGAFKYHKIKRSRIKELEGVSTPLEISSIGDGMIDIPFVNSRVDFDDFIKGLAHILIVENGVNDLADIKGMNFNKMFAYINNKLIPDLEKKLSKLRAYHKTGNFTQDITEEKLLTEIFSHERALSLYKSMGDPKYMKIYKTHLKKVLKTEYSINNIENNSEELLSEDDEETMSPQELITRYSKESFELNIVDNVTSNVKFLIATLPRSSEVNPITRTVKFVKFHDTWYELLFHLHDLDSIEDMMAKLKELGEQHHHFNILYKRLERRSPNLRNQFKTAVNKHKHMFINFTYTSETGNRKKGSPIVYQIYRADINRAEEEEKYVWAENFIQSKYVSHGEKAGDIQKINVEALTALYEDYVMFENKVRKEGRKQLSPEELNEYAETLLQFLHNVGIPIDRLTLDAYVQSKVKQVGKKIYGPREVLYSLITTEFSASNPRDDNQVGYFYKLKQLAELGVQREEDVKKYNELKAKKSKNIPTLPLYDLDANIRSIYTTRDSLYIIRELARKMFEVHPDLLNDVVIGPNGHQYFTYALNTYTTDTIKKLKDKSFIDKKLSKIGNKHSLFLQQLSESDIVREKISIRTMSSFQERDTNDSGSSYSDLNTIEDYILRLGALHNKETLVPFPIIADRSTYYFLDGLSLPRNIYELNPATGELEFTNEIIDIFVGYAEDERERIKAAKDIIKAYNDAEKRNDGSHTDILKNKMILNYHYKLKGNKIITAGANALKYIDFKEFNNKDFNFERDARNLIKEHLARVVAFGLNRAKKLKVYEVGIEEENNQEYIKNILIDNQIYKEYLSLFPNSSHAMQAILAFNEIGMIISNFEINKLFVGDPAFFKGDKEESIQQDRIKRLMVLTSSGDAISQKTIEKNIVDDHFTMASLTTQKLNMSSPEYREYDPSNYYYTLRNLLIVRHSQMLVREMKHKRDPLYGELKYILDEEYLRNKEGVLEFDIEKVNNIEKSVLREIFGIDINDILDSYRSVDSTDGQAYVSPSMFRAMLIQLGEWPEWKEAAYNNIMSRKDWYLMTKEEQDAVLKLYMQPLKPVFFDLVDNGNLEVPTYLKMSVMPLFPGLVDNMKLRELADRMEAIGKYSGLGKIDMVPYDSAIKVGLGYSVPLYKDQYKEDVSDLSDMSSTRLPFRSLRKQLVTDPHNITETKLGTQVIKITLSDLILDESVYNIPGIDSPITGKELAEVIFSSLASVSNKGLKRFKEKIGFDDKTNQINLKKLAETLREDAIKSNMPDLISDAFRTEGDNLYLELDTFSNRKQIFSRLIGMVTKHTIDIKMPGNQFIQLSATGINVSNSSNLAWYALDANGNVSAAECAISISLFKHLIPNYSTQSFKESADYVLNHIPELLVYRIPTQGQSSAMYLKVSRLLPEQVGDTIILPKAVTALTGSDFDIDKMFVVRHSYFINDSGKMEKVKFYDKEEDGKSPQELAFDNQQSYIVSKYKEDIKQLESKLFDPSVQQEDKINSVIEFTESLKEAIPESLYNSLQTLLSDMMLSELDETFVGIDNIKNIANLLNNWNYQEAKKEFLEKHKDSSPYEFNSEQAVKNRLLDAYLSVYKNTNSIPQTQSPLGAYKKLLTTLAGSIKEEDGGNMFHTYSASNQNILKFEYTGGKDGIGPFALNNSHHVLSQIAGLKYKGQSFGLLNTDSKGSIDLSAKLSRDNTNIMAWLSALIDAHVDLAKDNYIMKLNVNAATYNFIAFMIRGGFGLNTFKITSQPIIRDLAERINNSGRYSRMGLYTSKKQALEATKKDWVKLLSDEAKKVYDERKFDNNSVYDFIHVTKALEKKYYNVKVEELSGKEKDNFVLDQLMAFDIFEHFNKMGEDLNNFVQICQVDTKKFGRNVPEIIQYQKRVLDFKEANRFENANRLFPTDPRQIKDGESLLGPYYRNSVLFLLQMMPNLTIYSSPGFIDIVNTVLNLSGNGSTLNKKLVNNIADEVFAAIAGDFFFDVDEDGNPEENSFGLKTHHVANIMQGVIDTLTRIKYSDEPIAKRFRDNPIFSLLLKRPLSEDKGLPFTSYIAVVRKAFSDTASINDYMYGILDLLSATPKDESEVEMIKEIHKFARSLFVYSFLNSGFRNKLHSFFNVIPPVLYKNLETANGRKLSYNDFIKAKKELFSSDINTALSVYVDRVFKNNWMNKQIVTPIIDDHVAELADPFLRDIQYPVKDKKTGDITYKWRRAYNVEGITPPIKAIVLSYNKEGNVIYQRYYLGDNADGEPVFKKYIVYREERYDRTDTNNEPIQSFRPYLLEYVGYLIDSSEEEKKIHPVYKTVTRDSYEKSGIVVKTPGLTPGSIIKDANEEGLLIQDGEELQYFNDESIQSQVNGYEFVPVTNLVVMTSLEKKRVEQEGITRDTNKSERTTTVESTTPEFDKLPYRSIKKTMTYAGIGSRQTPPEILSQMTDIAKELGSKGYTLRTGDAKGADKSFREGTGNSEIYRADDATDVTRAIAKEIHPNPDALTDYALDLMARNTNQVFGENLDTPVDFVLYWAKESNNPMRPQGGTGQAVEMANLKGIPTINMAVEGWREKLDLVLSGKTKTDTSKELSTASSIYSQLGNKTVSSNVKLESWNSLKDMTEPFTKAYGSIVHIIATRIKNSNKHFGNPFTHDSKIANRNKDLIKVSSIKEAVIKYIDWVLNSSDERAQWIRKYLQTGELKGRPILYYDELHEPSHATALDYLINKYNWSSESQQLEVSEDITLNQLKDAINEKYKNQPNYTPLTLKDIVSMTPEQISNLKNCL